jgi:cytoskeletal protein RodZ
MIGISTAQTRLCPACANSIAEEATNCPYCKADVSSQFAPKWLKREESSPEPRSGAESHRRFAIAPKFIWLSAMVVLALLAFFAGGYLQRSQQSLLSQAYSKRLQEKDQTIQTQEAQLAQTRQQLNDNSTQLAEMKSKLDASQKEVSLAQQRLGAAARQVDHSNASRSPVVRRTSTRAPDATAPLPQPVAARRTTSAAGAYETTRPTSVHEDPSSSSRVITQIDKGTRINVVSSAGEWLEVRSKRGNPPGYIRSDDARPSGAVN